MALEWRRVRLVLSVHSSMPSSLFFRVAKENLMLYYALVFFIIAIVAAVLGFSGLAASAAGIAKILFVVFLVMAIATFVVNLLRGR